MVHEVCAGTGRQGVSPCAGAEMVAMCGMNWGKADDKTAAIEQIRTWLNVRCSSHGAVRRRLADHAAEQGVQPLCTVRSNAHRTPAARSARGEPLARYFARVTFRKAKLDARDSSAESYSSQRMDALDGRP